MSGSLRYEDFLAHLASDCSLRYSADCGASQPAMPAILAEVGERRERQGFEVFSLLFHAHVPGTPQQGNHEVTFAGGASWDIFLVPIAREGTQVVYEAVFNRAVAS